MIRWITDRLGTAPATSADITDDLRVLDVRDMVDKHGNEADAVRGKIEQGVAALGEGVRLVVCCDYGISRSNSIAAGILAVTEDIPLSQAARRVSAATGELDMKLEPMAAVSAALGQARRAAHDGDTPRLLVTGGSGFIGQALKRAQPQLASGFVSRDDADLMGGPLALDILAKESGAQRILHLANPRVYTSNRALGEMVTMLRNVLDVCRANDAELIYLSGWEVYSGYRSPEITADEQLPLLPKGPYGEAKLLCENLIELHRRLYGLRATIVRPTPVYGPGSDRPKFIFNFLAKALASAPIRCHQYANGKPALELLHVDDLIAAILAILARPVGGSVNLGGGRLITTEAIARMIVDIVGSGSVIEVNQIADDVANVRMDASLAKREIGWEPRIRFEQGLRQLIGQARGE